MVNQLETNGMANDLEKDLEVALAKDMANTGTPPTGGIPFRRTTMPKILQAADEKPDRAADQLAVAVKGLLQLEQEFRGLAVELVGDLKFEEIDKQQPSEESALIPRLRSDAELIARLAIRMHRLIEEVRTKL